MNDAAAITLPPARVIQWTRACAAFVLGLAAIGVWWGALGEGTLWALPLLVAVSGVAGGVFTLDSRRARLAFPWLWIPWAPVAFLLSGLPLWTLSPLEIPRVLGQLGEALRVGLQGSGPSTDPWLLAAWLVICGLAWFPAAVQAQRGTAGSRASAAVAFFLFAAPFALALIFSRTPDAAWQGGAALVGGLLWATRGNLRDGLPALAVTAILGVVVALAIAPRERWSQLDPQNRGKPPASSIEHDHQYGPINQSQTGRRLFTIRAQGPSLWRMETLERFNGRGWLLDDSGQGRELPQPGAVQTTSTVTMDHLVEPLAIAPGRIETVSGANIAASARANSTESVTLTPRPRQGSSYTVVSEEVPFDVAALSDVRIPRGDKYARLTTVIPEYAQGSPAAQAYAPVAELAQRLTAGATSQLEAVDRIQTYLTSSGTFKYTTNVRQPGSYPLIEFLFETHEGYCQHFAGAAALLLRFAGVPTRVVSGFGTGEKVGQNEWDVDDKNGHAWIEVYFPGHGWVQFNPTGGTIADVAPGVGSSNGKDPNERPEQVAGARVPIELVVLVLVLAGVGYLFLRLLLKPRGPVDPLGDVLARIVPAPAGPSMTFAELREDLRQLGPAVSALADEAEHQRFGPPGQPPEPHPRRRVWRALLADVGLLRTARIVLLGPGRRPIVESAGPKIASSGPPPSIAPPA